MCRNSLELGILLSLELGKVALIAGNQVTRAGASAHSAKMLSARPGVTTGKRDSSNDVYATVDLLK